LESGLFIAGLCALTLLATSFDNLLLLVAIHLRPGQDFVSMVWGVLFASLALLTLCIVGAELAVYVAPGWIGYLGLIPITLGLRELYAWWRNRGGTVEEMATGARPLSATAIALIMLANGWDSLAALMPIFAESRFELVVWGAGAIVIVSLLGCVLARAVSRSEWIGRPLARIAPVLVPIVLISVGLYVLSDTRTDRFEDEPVEAARADRQSTANASLVALHTAAGRHSPR
jgi:cadmium resistance protein CadD (predicted permease)